MDVSSEGERLQTCGICAAVMKISEHQQDTELAFLYFTMLCEVKCFKEIPFRYKSINTTIPWKDKKKIMKHEVMNDIENLLIIGNILNCHEMRGHDMKTYFTNYRSRAYRTCFCRAMTSNM